MASKPIVPITTGKEDYAERLASVIGSAFARDALNRAVVLTKDSLPNDSEISDERRAEHFLPQIRNQAKNGAVLVESGNWAAVALWVPPGVHAPLRDRSALPLPMVEYIDKFSDIKKKYLGERQYWYLDLIGRDPKRTESGVVRGLFEPFLKQAQEAGLPAWLEATNEHARDVYAHFGFKVVEEVVIGAGSVGQNGDLIPGGEGIVIYGMLAEHPA